MNSSLLFFCNECGAANSEQANYCIACNQVLSTSSPLPGLMEYSSLAPITGPLPPGFRLAGRYYIISQIGQGGFGVVYKAKDTKQQDKLVAIKQINLHDLTTREIIDATTTYNREVTVLSKLKHSSLPRVYDHFSEPEHWYLVMDFIEGETLEDYCDKAPGGGLPVEECMDIGIELCEVLDYLHSQEPPVIFRDVKPANIMRTPDGRLYLIDFGIARYFKPKKARDTEALGSRGFAAPEQYGKAQTTPRTDVYGLGATLQTLLVGHSQDEAYTGKVTARQKRFQRLLNQMLKTNARKRPRNIREVQKILKAVRGGLPKLIIRYILRYFKGVFISLLPILALVLLLLVPFLNYLVIFVLVCCWWMFLILELIIASKLLSSPHGRLEGLGALTLPLLVVAILVWLNLSHIHLVF